MKKTGIAIFVFVLSVMTIGCSEMVPPGYVGAVISADGLQDRLLSPGRHECWGRDKMILIETKEQTVSEKLSILCKDDLNFKFDLNVRATLRPIKTNGQLSSLFKKKGSDIRNGTLQFISLYKTYVKPLARSMARGEVSRFQTTQVRENRKQIEKAILIGLQKALKGTPMVVTAVTTSNFDYPKVITAAVEKKRQREIEIEEEKANQAKELLKAENRLKLAQKMKMVKAAEAQADAIGIQILGKSLTTRYLEWKKIERDKLLYEKVGVGDKVIITNGNAVTPIIGGTK
jgi:hypothetical protein